MLWPHNFSSAYFARHWACAIDVIELVATLGDCSRPEIAGDDMRWDKVALEAMSLLLPYVNDAVFSLTGAACRLTLRQAWGLTMRSERALREVAPHWSKLEAGGRSSAPLCTCLGATSLLASLVHEKPLEAWKAEDTSALLLQLLTSNTASLLKLCWHSGRSEGVVMNKGLILHLFYYTTSPSAAPTSGLPARMPSWWRARPSSSCLPLDTSPTPSTPHLLGLPTGLPDAVILGWWMPSQ